jgi:hypothetical protein
VVLPLLSFLVGESHLLILLCACDRCGMAGSDEDRGSSRRHGAKDQEWSGTGRVLGDRSIERLGDIVCALYRACEDK